MMVKQRPVRAQDELESFFYVLLDAAVRHLPNNLEDPEKFLGAFFSIEPCSAYPYGWSVSPWKLDALDQCRILRAPSADGSELRFYWRPRKDGEKSEGEDEGAPEPPISAGRFSPV